VVKRNKHRWKYRHRELLLPSKTNTTANYSPEQQTTKLRRYKKEKKTENVTTPMDTNEQIDKDEEVNKVRDREQKEQNYTKARRWAEESEEEPKINNSETHNQVTPEGVPQPVPHPSTDDGHTRWPTVRSHRKCAQHFAEYNGEERKSTKRPQARYTPNCKYSQKHFCQSKE
jgi:hypothetical protein